MTLAAAFALIAGQSGLSVSDVEAVVTAAAMSDGNKREMVRMARRMEGRVCAVVRININRGMMTDVRYELTSESLEWIVEAR